MNRIELVQKPQEGCLGRSVLRYMVGRGEVKADRYSEVPVFPSSNRQDRLSTREESWRNPVKAFAASPGGVKPKGGAGDCKLKTRCRRWAILIGMDPETEACRAGPARFSGGKTPSQRYVGSSEPKGYGDLLGVDTSER
jgi:hypothetical protein